MTALTIVLVDDDPMMHRMLVPRLRELAFDPGVAEVMSAMTPEDALDIVEGLARMPLAVLTDFNLKASMTGLDLLRRVKAERPDALRVLFSGYSQVEIGDVSGDGAAHAFFEKPMRIDDLVRPILRILSGAGA